MDQNLRRRVSYIVDDGLRCLDSIPKSETQKAEQHTEAAIIHFLNKLKNECMSSPTVDMKDRIVNLLEEKVLEYEKAHFHSKSEDMILTDRANRILDDRSTFIDSIGDDQRNYALRTAAISEVYVLKYVLQDLQQLIDDLTNIHKSQIENYETKYFKED